MEHRKDLHRFSKRELDAMREQTLKRKRELYPTPTSLQVLFHRTTMELRRKAFRKII